VSQGLSNIPGLCLALVHWWAVRGLKPSNKFSMFAEFLKLFMEYLWIIYGCLAAEVFFDSCSGQVPFAGQRFASLIFNRRAKP
jgi:hypothetical protein